MTKRMSRRAVLKAGALAGAGLLASGRLSNNGSEAPRVLAQEGAPAQAQDRYLPYVPRDAMPTYAPTPTHTPTATPTSTPGTGPRVIRVHAKDATHWDGQTDYWNYVDQDVVNEMVDRGMMALTGASSVADAWRTLLPAYQRGQGIAIKVNLNSVLWVCDDTDGQIDALIQPVNAVVRGLLQIGVRQTDVWVYDARRRASDRFVGGCLYRDVRFYDRIDGGCRIPVSWSSDDPDATVTFTPPDGTPLPETERLTDLVIDATYLINMPIPKTHALAGVTAGFKNHFGTIDGPSHLHPYIGVNESLFSVDYNPLVDIYLNPHIGPKTVLTLGDALFACLQGAIGHPTPWETFGNQVPNSLFFATDPVAVDCVICDFVAAEAEVPATADAYLRLARDAGLGVFERGDPWGSGYSQIDYLPMEL